MKVAGGGGPHFPSLFASITGPSKYCPKQGLATEPWLENNYCSLSAFLQAKPRHLTLMEKLVSPRLGKKQRRCSREREFNKTPGFSKFCPPAAALHTPTLKIRGWRKGEAHYFFHLPSKVEIYTQTHRRHFLQRNTLRFAWLVSATPVWPSDLNLQSLPTFFLDYALSPFLLCRKLPTIVENTTNDIPKLREGVKTYCKNTRNCKKGSRSH